MLREILDNPTGILVIGSQCVNKQSQDSDETKADFFQLNLPGIHEKIG